jgi:hypothetical protein
MKKVLVTFILLIAFNFSAPNPNLMNLRQRHLIEFAQENHTKSISVNEIVKNKASIYLRMFIIMSVIDRMEERKAELNTS